MKKLLSVIMCLFVLISNSLVIVLAEETIINDELEFAGGKGTKGDPYQVATPEQLNNIRNHLDAHFIQICDIDMTEITSAGGLYWNEGAGWEPIGAKYNDRFVGTFNGRNHKIIGLNCNSKIDYIGLFGYIGAESELLNIYLERCRIDGYDKGICIGGIVGYCMSGSYIENCYVTGDITGNGSYVGGIAGYTLGTICYCYNRAIITNISESLTSCTGGIVGSGSELSFCHNAGEIQSKGNVGGIAGYSDSSVNKCHNSGVVYCTYQSNSYVHQTDANCVGGIIGYYCNSSGTRYVKNCSNVGYVRSNSKYNLGAIIGCIYYLTNVKFENCYNFNTNSKVKICYDYGSSYSSLNNVYQLDINSDKEKGIILLSAEEMKEKVNFEGFDFDVVWDVDPYINSGLPYLRNIPTSKINVNVNSRYFTEIETMEEISGIIAIAVYDNKNRLLEINTYPSTESVQATLDMIDLGEHIKVMWWTSLSSMKPLCKPKLVNLST